MQRHAILALIAGLTVGLAGTAQADNIPWAPSLGQAVEKARRENKPVLLHFWSETCAPCRDLERYVFPHPDVARSITANCVPIKVNVAQQRELGQRFGIRQIPTDVFVTADGKEVWRSSSPPTANEYIAMVDRVGNSSRFAVDQQARQIAQYDQTQRGGTWQGGQPTQPRIDQSSHRANSSQWQGQQQPPSSGGSWNPNATQTPSTNSQWRGFDQGNSQPQPSFQTNDHYQPQPNGHDRAEGSTPQVEAQRWQREQAQSPQLNPEFDAAASTSSQRPAPRQKNPPLGLDGFCPVTLLTKQQWKRGDPKYGAVHRGRTYLFADEQAFKVFWANPDAYCPALSGFDAVQFLERNEKVEGQRKHGVFYRDKVTGRQQIFLFADEASLNQFWKNPGGYSTGVHQAMSQSALWR